MKNLLHGIKKFREEDFETNKELFQGLKGKQQPHSLFITCSDSRIDPNMITKALPGELFIIRNIANIVPPYRETDEYVATTSAIEYAVLALNVENIIVCGHSNCGGCAACLSSSHQPDQLPHTHKWLELIHPVRDRVYENFSHCEPEVRAWMMEQGNIVQQLNNLTTYPFIHERVAAGQLNVSGWHYIIETGEVLVYNDKNGEFQLEN